MVFGISKRLGSTFNALIDRFESDSSRARREAEQESAAEQKQLRAAMKPADGKTGYMFDDSKPAGVVILVDTKKFLQEYQSARKDQPLSRSRIRSASKAFEANNNLHLMASAYVENGEIHLLEGNHRLELLKYQPSFLINLFNKTGGSEQEFAGQIKLFIEKCGVEDAGIRKHGEAVFCQVDFSDDGHFARNFAQRQKAPYFTAGQ